MYRHVARMKHSVIRGNRASQPRIPLRFIQATLLIRLTCIENGRFLYRLAGICIEIGKMYAFTKVFILSKLLSLC